MNVTRSLALSFCLVWPAALAAQPVEVYSDGGAKEGTYIKGGVAHWQGDLDNKPILADWSPDLFGVNYNLTSVSVAIEHYFGRTAGLSVGYRKDALGYDNAGHMFSASVFGGPIDHRHHRADPQRWRGLRPSWGADLNGGRSRRAILPPTLAVGGREGGW